MVDRARPDLARAARGLEHAQRCEADGPSSEVRPLDTGEPSRALHIATRLRGSDAESALVTVTDAAGRVHYEGPLEGDGTITIALPSVHGAARVRVLLETARWHRQADVVLATNVTEHAFA